MSMSTEADPEEELLPMLPTGELPLLTKYLACVLELGFVIVFVRPLLRETGLPCPEVSRAALEPAEVCGVDRKLTLSW